MARRKSTLSKWMAEAEKNRKRRDREATIAANERKRQQKRADIDARKREREQVRIAREKEKEKKAVERLKAQEEKIKKIKNQWVNRLSLELEKRNIIAQNNLVLDLIEEANDSGLTATQAVSLLIKGNEAKLAIRAIVLIFEKKLHSRHHDKKEIRQIAERLAKLDDMNSAKALADGKWKAFKEKCEKEDLEILELNNLYDRVAKLPMEKIVLPYDVPNLEALIGYAYKTTSEFENSEDFKEALKRKADYLDKVNKGLDKFIKADLGRESDPPAPKKKINEDKEVDKEAAKSTNSAQLSKDTKVESSSEKSWFLMVLLYLISVLGLLGLHRIYLGLYASGVLYSAAFIVYIYLYSVKSLEGTFAAFIFVLLLCLVVTDLFILVFLGFKDKHGKKVRLFNKREI